MQQPDAHTACDLFQAFCAENCQAFLEGLDKKLAAPGQGLQNTTTYSEKPCGMQPASDLVLVPASSEPGNGQLRVRLQKLARWFKKRGNKVFAPAADVEAGPSDCPQQAPVASKKAESNPRLSSSSLGCSFDLEDLSFQGPALHTQPVAVASGVLAAEDQFLHLTNAAEAEADCWKAAVPARCCSLLLHMDSMDQQHTLHASELPRRFTTSANAITSDPLYDYLALQSSHPRCVTRSQFVCVPCTSQRPTPGSLSFVTMATGSADTLLAGSGTCTSAESEPGYPVSWHSLLEADGTCCQPCDASAAADALAAPRPVVATSCSSRILKSVLAPSCPAARGTCWNPDARPWTVSSFASPPKWHTDTSSYYNLQRGGAAACNYAYVLLAM